MKLFKEYIIENVQKELLPITDEDIQQILSALNSGSSKTFQRKIERKDDYTVILTTVDTLKDTTTITYINHFAYGTWKIFSRNSKEEYNSIRYITTFVNPRDIRPRLHRLDGPAFEIVDVRNYPKDKGFYIDGKRYSESEYWKQPKVVVYNKVKGDNSSNITSMLDL